MRTALRVDARHSGRTMPIACLPALSGVCEGAVDPATVLTRLRRRLGDGRAQSTSNPISDSVSSSSSAAAAAVGDPVPVIDAPVTGGGTIADGGAAAPLGERPAAVRAWFDDLFDQALPVADGTLATAQRTAEALARRAKAENTRRAYRAGVRAWCTWCEGHGLTPLPAGPAAVAAFLAAERYPLPPAKPLAANTLRLRLAAIGYLHYLAGLPSPTTTAIVGETIAGLERTARRDGDGPRPKLAAKIGLLREILAPIKDDLPGLRDRALLLLGFAGALRRAELARITIADLEESEHGLRITLPVSKGDRRARGVVVGIPYGTSALCPVRALRRWCAAAQISDGPLFRRIWTTPRPPTAPAGGTPTFVVGEAAIDPGTVARIVKARGAAAGFDHRILGGHSLKRGAMNTAKDRRVHPAQLKQLGRHASYATLAAYIEEGDLFEDNALNGVL
ncbi:MAG: site-specific integrase [Rhodospirillales bacterium]|nr:site-specific integrase [Rhodospirillales bacterium]